MATHAHSTRTPLLPQPGSSQPLLGTGLGHGPGPVTQAIRAMRTADHADQAIAAIENGRNRHFAEAAARGSAIPATLAKRAAALRHRFDAHIGHGAQDPHVPLRDRLIAAHSAAMSVRWVFDAEDPDAEPYKAALAVDNALRRLLTEVMAMPAPRTMAGLSVVGLAAAMEVEGALSHRCLENEDKLAVTARAILSLTGTKLPASFLGFGDEPDFEARERSILTPPAE